MLKELRSVHGRIFLIKKVPYGRIVVLHQPTVETLLAAEKYRAMADGKIYRVDLAYDLRFLDPRFELGNFIRQNVALKFRVKQPIHIVDGEVSKISNVDRWTSGSASTMYWRLFPAAIVTNLLHYNDRPGKVEDGASWIANCAVEELSRSRLGDIV